MLELSKVERKGITYSLKDTVARAMLQEKYSKPASGIPTNDLSIEVQNLLDKARTAIQNFTEKDPTVPAWAKQRHKPTYTAQEVGALPYNTHIPADQVNADWNASSGVAQILNKPTLFSGDYNDLINSPTEVSYFNNDAGYTGNIGTLTGIIMNGVTMATSGLVNLGSVITAHQDLSGKQDVLVSGSNIKSVNGQSVLGSGDIDTLDAVVDEETETLILS